MISQTAEYALRAMAWLVKNRDKPQTTGQIAQGMKIPSDYLSKVLQQLNQAGLVVSRRGLGGGFALGKEPTKITPLDIITCIDPMRSIESCPLGLEEHGKKLCPIHEKLDDAMTKIKEAFGSCTMAELCSE